MSSRLKGRVAVVTGSGSGIGRAVAIAIAKEGAVVVTNNRKPGSVFPVTYGEEWLKSLKKSEAERALKESKELTGDAATTAKEIREMGGEAVPFFGDVSNFEIAGNLIQTAVSSFGKVDILVNVAGTFMHNWCWEMTSEQWHHVTDNKPTSAFNTIRHASPLMIKQKWGRIINCTSSAWLGSFDHCNYSSANAGVVGLSRAVARELWQFGITCNIFAPSAFTRAIANMATRGRQMADQGTPIFTTAALGGFEFMAGPEALAPFIVYLATNEAANITGTVFAVGGGHIGRYSEPAEVATLDKKEGWWTVDELVDQVPKVLLKGYTSAAATAAQAVSALAKK